MSMNILIQNTVKIAVSALMAVLATTLVVQGIDRAAMTDMNGVSLVSVAAMSAQSPLG
jgi:hypothetical protein